MSPFIVLPLAGWAALILLFAALWIWQQKHRDAGIVDVGWAAGLAILAIFYGMFGLGHPIRRILVALLGGAWGFRLATYLLFDRVIGKPEDGRYQTLRRAWGHRASPAFFVFFQAQGLLDVVLSLPFLLAAMDPAPAPRATDLAAAILWSIALTGEAVADRQLAKWRGHPYNRGRTCRAGLWRLSRHPNYFFEWLIWCAFAILAFPAHWGWTAIGAPVLMLFFIFRLTGIPATEAQAIASRGDDYRSYQAETSVFIPWFPRKRPA
ncbi:MAG: DUF1295 domain-containing protein [Candidatus Eisenbacteria bacterium]|nr:DUF1295 domain-containing protein [Candidatus Eisenbacteria bacterium]